MTTGPEWGLSFSYDGFGNRTAQTVTKGSAPVANLTYDVATNRLMTAGFGYDANGNVTALPGGPTQTYDVENRLVNASGQGYGYDQNNKRVVVKVGYPEEEICLQSVRTGRVVRIRFEEKCHPDRGRDEATIGALHPTEVWIGRRDGSSFVVVQPGGNCGI